MTTVAVFGATGRVGAATARRLTQSGVSVRAIGHRTAADAPAVAARADLSDPRSVAAAVEGCDRVQVICPTTPRAADPAGRMSAISAALVAGLRTVPEVAVLAISDYGAEVPTGTGITAAFHELETRLSELPNPLTFVRSAEHMHNWGRQIPAALKTGTLTTMHHPLTKVFPTVYGPDLGTITADLLLEPLTHHGSPRVIHVEGPRRYTALDVAAALAAVSGRAITARELPRAEWEPRLTAAGATPAFARLAAELYDAHNAGLIGTPTGADVRYGTTSLQDAFTSILAG
jgi:NAD(P)H dehydrogenase (quinone)